MKYQDKCRLFVQSVQDGEYNGHQYRAVWAANITSPAAQRYKCPLDFLPVVGEVRDYLVECDLGGRDYKPYLRIVGFAD